MLSYYVLKYRKSSISAQLYTSTHVNMYVFLIYKEKPNFG